MTINDLPAFARVRNDRRATIRLPLILKIGLGRHVRTDTASRSDLLLPGFPPSTKEDRLPREVLRKLALVDRIDEVPQGSLRVRGR